MKICPLLAIANVELDRRSPEAYTCIEERCAFWMHTNQGGDCAVVFIADIAYRIAAAKFPSSVLLHSR